MASEKRVEEIIRRATRFTNLKNAWDYTYRALKPMTVMHGDDGYYWIVTLGESTILQRLGYEIAPNPYKIENEYNNKRH
ncbi:MAG: hypothetical protein KatS3mg079_468 [Caloramator sp.]|jgi:hypothetical protein|nr:MAG: hypothetical protein KatS3mg079_468 [Caloramator sp.]